jgi:pimeloyl-ACP methyl ester carboxylesterase
MQMMEAKQEQEEDVKLRIHGEEGPRPSIVYLPGLHGDWTLIGRFRKALGERARFVEITYPRTLTWSLEEYAAAIAERLTREGIGRVWLLAESFGSQIVWPLLAQKKLSIEGVILAGGFVRHPTTWGVRLADRLLGRISLGLITGILFGYARLARARFGRGTQMRKDIEEFIARRTPLDLKAAQHRLRLLAVHDPCDIASSTETPIYALSGLFDPIVPWFWVRRWLKKNCRALREYKIIGGADHNVLGTAPLKSANLVMAWIGHAGGR